MKCKKCGAYNAPVKKSCYNCGAFLEGETINNVTGQPGYRNADGSFTPCTSDIEPIPIGGTYSSPIKPISEETVNGLSNACSQFAESMKKIKEFYTGLLESTPVHDIIPIPPHYGEPAIIQPIEQATEEASIIMLEGTDNALIGLDLNLPESL